MRAIRSLKPLPGAAGATTPPAAASSSAAAATAASHSTDATASAATPNDAIFTAASAAHSAAAASTPASSAEPDASSSIVLKSPSQLLLDMCDDPSYTLGAQLRTLQLQLNQERVVLHLDARGRRGRTLLQRIIELHAWGELRAPLEARSVFSNRAHIARLLSFLDSADVTLRDEDGNNALHLLASFPIPNLSDPQSFGCLLLGKLVARGIDVNARGELGRTAVNTVGNRCAHAPIVGGSIAPLLLGQYGADPTLPDIDGNTLAHNLARQQLWRLLEQITSPAAHAGAQHLAAAAAASSSSSSSAGSSPTLWQTQPVLRFGLYHRNRAGETAFDVAARIYSATPTSRDAHATHDVLQRLQRAWRKGVRSQLQALVQARVPVAVLADLIVQYVDGSGRRFAETS